MKIVIEQHGIVVVDGGNGIEQRRHEKGFRIPDASGVLADTVHDLFDMHGGDLLKRSCTKPVGYSASRPIAALVDAVLGDVFAFSGVHAEFGNDGKAHTGMVQTGHCSGNPVSVPTTPAASRGVSTLRLSS